MVEPLSFTVISQPTLTMELTVFMEQEPVANHLPSSHCDGKLISMTILSVLVVVTEQEISVMIVTNMVIV